MSTNKLDAGVTGDRAGPGAGRRRALARAGNPALVGMTRAVFVALALLCAHCQREAAPQPSSGPMASAASPPLLTASASPPVGRAVPSAPAVSAGPRKHGPAPAFEPGKQIAWQIEQDGRPVEAKNQVVELRRGPFTLVLHLRAQIDHLWANASFEPKTFDAARLGWRFAALPGFQGGAGGDLHHPSAGRRRLQRTRPCGTVARAGGCSIAPSVPRGTALQLCPSGPREQP